MPSEIAPLIRWAGSKKQILDHLTPFAAGASRYIEPFAGSACLFFRLRPRRAILGDLNGELISTYRALKQNAEEIHVRLMQLRNSREEYLELRSIDPMTLDLVSGAARFLYLNRFCFNGLYRTNLSGKFNVPYGGHKSGTLPSREHLLATSRLLRRATLIRGRFQRTLARARPGDFVYMDPPFSVEAKRTFKEYSQYGFSADDLVALRQAMEQMADRKIAFLVSYAECAESEYLATGFKVRKLAVKRHIAGSFANRVTSSEVLIFP